MAPPCLPGVIFIHTSDPQTHADVKLEIKTEQESDEIEW